MRFLALFALLRFCAFALLRFFMDINVRIIKKYLLYGLIDLKTKILG